MNQLEEKTISSTEVFHGRVVQVKTETASLPDGQTAYREVVEHPGGVAIALADGEGKYFLVSQWRYAQKRVMLEFPAGKKEPGEDPLATAKREIEEETGWRGKNFEFLGEIVPTGAYDTERISLYFAEKDCFVGSHPDSDENLVLSRMNLEELTEKILSGEINDAKTIAMVFLLKERKKEC